MKRKLYFILYFTPNCSLLSPTSVALRGGSIVHRNVTKYIPYRQCIYSNYLGNPPPRNNHFSFSTNVSHTSKKSFLIFECYLTAPFFLCSGGGWGRGGRGIIYWFVLWMTNPLNSSVHTWTYWGLLSEPTMNTKYEM